MMNTIYGTFKNLKEFEAYAKAQKINEYRNLAKRFAENASIELSVMLSDMSIVLHDRYSLSWEQIAELEA